MRPRRKFRQGAQRTVLARHVTSGPLECEAGTAAYFAPCSLQKAASPHTCDVRSVVTRRHTHTQGPLAALVYRLDKRACTCAQIVFYACQAAAATTRDGAFMFK